MKFLHSNPGKPCYPLCWLRIRAMAIENDSQYLEWPLSLKNGLAPHMLLSQAFFKFKARLSVRRVREGNPEP